MYRIPQYIPVYPIPRRDARLTSLRFGCSLAAVNFCLFIVGTVQCSRIFIYRQSHKGTEGALKEIEQDVAGSIKDVEKKVEQKL